MKLLMPLCVLLVFYGTVERIDAWNSLVDFQVPGINQPSTCSDIDVSFDYRRAIYNFAVQTVKALAHRNNYHSSISPLSAWLSLATFVEGSNEKHIEELLLVLGLPQDRCLRQKYYEIALQRETSGSDVSLTRTRLLAFDDNVSVNKNWAKSANKLLTGISIPIKHNPNAAVDVIRQLLGARISTLNLKGNSILLDSLEARMLWTEAFSDAIIEESPFYNDFGEQIGTVDMMISKKRVRMSYHPRGQMKVIELPVGHNGRYRMLIGISLGITEESVKILSNEIMFDIINKLRFTKGPINVAIPRFTMTTEIDLRNVFEDLGLQRLWKDPSATRNISEPAALPSGLFQRTTIVFDKAGIKPYTEEEPGIGFNNDDTFHDSVLSQDFIANKPFIVGLCDAETYSVISTTIFSRPTSSFLFK